MRGQRFQRCSQGTSAARNKELTDKTGINVEEWLSKVPDEIKNLLGPVLKSVARDSELPTEAAGTAMQNIHALVPEYPKYHWRHLHEEIKGISKADYEAGNYFDAAEKACRLYVQRMKENSGIDTGNDSSDADRAFNQGDGVLMVTNCSDTTENNIQAGQQLLSKGMIAGFRNPLTHNPEYQKKLIDTGLFTEKDCLDVLSLLSHLFGRLEKAKKRPATP